MEKIEVYESTLSRWGNERQKRKFPEGLTETEVLASVVGEVKEIAETVAGITKESVGLPNVDNVKQIPASEKGTPGGVPHLNAEGEVVEKAQSADFADVAQSYKIGETGNTKRIDEAFAETVTKQAGKDLFSGAFGDLTGKPIFINDNYMLERKLLETNYLFGGFGYNRLILPANHNVNTITNNSDQTYFTIENAGKALQIQSENGLDIFFNSILPASNYFFFRFSTGFQSFKISRRDITVFDLMENYPEFAPTVNYICFNTPYNIMEMGVVTMDLTGEFVVLENKSNFNVSVINSTTGTAMAKFNGTNWVDELGDPRTGGVIPPHTLVIFQRGTWYTTGAGGYAYNMIHQITNPVEKFRSVSTDFTFEDNQFNFFKIPAYADVSSFVIDCDAPKFTIQNLSVNPVAISANPPYSVDFATILPGDFLTFIYDDTDKRHNLYSSNRIETGNEPATGGIVYKVLTMYDIIDHEYIINSTDDLIITDGVFMSYDDIEFPENSFRDKIIFDTRTFDTFIPNKEPRFLRIHFLPSIGYEVECMQRNATGDYIILDATNSPLVLHNRTTLSIMLFWDGYSWNIQDQLRG